ncbi:MAG: hypothetical protein WA002_09160 [Candidatus Acidiferrales bacterium]
MNLPETIPVRYTEEEAEYLSLRPVVKQTFRIAELVDMIVSVTGKDAARVTQILRSGSVVYHGYRYWWSGFEAADGELGVLLAAYPDAEPERRFDPAACTAMIFESGGAPPRHTIEIPRAIGERHGWLRFRSFWDDAMEHARANPPAYREYSYGRRADTFVSPLDAAGAARLAEAARKRLPRAMRAQASLLHSMTQIVWICSRAPAKK